MTGGCQAGGGGGSLRCTGSGSRGNGFGGFGGGFGPGKLGSPLSTTSSFLTFFFTGVCCLFCRLYKTMRTAAKRRRRMVRRPATTPRSTSMGRKARSGSSVLGSAAAEASCRPRGKPERFSSNCPNGWWNPDTSPNVGDCHGSSLLCCWAFIAKLV